MYLFMFLWFVILSEYVIALFNRQENDFQEEHEPPPDLFGNYMGHESDETFYSKRVGEFGEMVGPPEYGLTMSDHNFFNHAKQISSYKHRINANGRYVQPKPLYKNYYRQYRDTITRNKNIATRNPLVETTTNNNKPNASNLFPKKNLYSSGIIDFGNDTITHDIHKKSDEPPPDPGYNLNNNIKTTTIKGKLANGTNNVERHNNTDGANVDKIADPNADTKNNDKVIQRKSGRNNGFGNYDTRGFGQGRSAGLNDPSRLIRPEVQKKIPPGFFGQESNQKPIERSSSDDYGPGAPDGPGAAHLPPGLGPMGPNGPLRMPFSGPGGPKAPGGSGGTRGIGSGGPVAMPGGFGQGGMPGAFRTGVPREQRFGGSFGPGGPGSQFGPVMPRLGPGGQGRGSPDRSIGFGPNAQGGFGPRGSGGGFGSGGQMGYGPGGAMGGYRSSGPGNQFWKNGPGAPGQLGALGQPGIPGQSITLGQPGEPERQSALGQPGKPEQPGTPGQAGVPEQSGTLGQPGETKRLSAPEQSVQPEQPGAYGQLGAPEQPGAPGQPGAGGSRGQIRLQGPRPGQDAPLDYGPGGLKSDVSRFGSSGKPPGGSDYGRFGPGGGPPGGWQSGYGEAKPSGIPKFGSTGIEASWTGPNALLYHGPSALGWPGGYGSGRLAPGPSNQNRPQQIGKLGPDYILPPEFGPRGPDSSGPMAGMKLMENDHKSPIFVIEKERKEYERLIKRNRRNTIEGGVPPPPKLTSTTLLSSYKTYETSSYFPGQGAPGFPNLRSPYDFGGLGPKGLLYPGREMTPEALFPTKDPSDYGKPDDLDDMYKSIPKKQLGLVPGASTNPISSTYLDHIGTGLYGLRGAAEAITGYAGKPLIDEFGLNNINFPDAARLGRTAASNEVFEPTHFFEMLQSTTKPTILIPPTNFVEMPGQKPGKPSYPPYVFPGAMSMYPPSMTSKRPQQLPNIYQTYPRPDFSHLGSFLPRNVRVPQAPPNYPNPANPNEMQVSYQDSTIGTNNITSTTELSNPAMENILETAKKRNDSALFVSETEPPLTEIQYVTETASIEPVQPDTPNESETTESKITETQKKEQTTLNTTDAYEIATETIFEPEQFETITETVLVEEITIGGNISTVETTAAIMEGRAQMQNNDTNEDPTNTEQVTLNDNKDVSQEKEPTSENVVTTKETTQQVNKSSSNNNVDPVTLVIIKNEVNSTAENKVGRQATKIITLTPKYTGKTYFPEFTTPTWSTSTKDPLSEKIGDVFSEESHIPSTQDALAYLLTAVSTTTVTIEDILKEFEPVPPGQSEQLHTEILAKKKEMKFGWFTTFVYYLLTYLKDLDEKTSARIRYLFSFEIYTQQNTKKLISNFGQPFNRALKSFGSYLETLSPEEAKSLDSMALELLVDRRQLLSKELNSVLDLVDSHYTAEDTDEIIHLIEDFSQYPKQFNNTKDLMARMFQHVVLEPFMRLKGTVNSELVRTQINDYLMDTFYADEKNVEPVPLDPKIGGGRRVLLGANSDDDARTNFKNFLKSFKDKINSKSSDSETKTTKNRIQPIIPNAKSTHKTFESKTDDIPVFKSIHREKPRNILPKNPTNPPPNANPINLRSNFKHKKRSEKKYKQELMHLKRKHPKIYEKYISHHKKYNYKFERHKYHKYDTLINDYMRKKKAFRKKKKHRHRHAHHRKRHHDKERLKIERDGGRGLNIEQNNGEFFATRGGTGTEKSPVIITVVNNINVITEKPRDTSLPLQLNSSIFGDPNDTRNFLNKFLNMGSPSQNLSVLQNTNMKTPMFFGPPSNEPMRTPGPTTITPNALSRPLPDFGSFNPFNQNDTLSKWNGADHTTSPDTISPELLEKIVKDFYNTQVTFRSISASHSTTMNRNEIFTHTATTNALRTDHDMSSTRLFDPFNGINDWNANDFKNMINLQQQKDKNGPNKYFASAKFYPVSSATKSVSKVKITNYMTTKKYHHHPRHRSHKHKNRKPHVTNKRFKTVRTDSPYEVLKKMMEKEREIHKEIEKAKSRLHTLKTNVDNVEQIKISMNNEKGNELQHPELWKSAKPNTDMLLNFENFLKQIPLEGNGADKNLETAIGEMHNLLQHPVAMNALGNPRTSDLTFNAFPNYPVEYTTHKIDIYKGRKSLQDISSQLKKIKELLGYAVTTNQPKTRTLKKGFPSYKQYIKNLLYQQKIKKNQKKHNDSHHHLGSNTKLKSIQKNKPGHSHPHSHPHINTQFWKNINRQLDKINTLLEVAGDNYRKKIHRANLYKKNLKHLSKKELVTQKKIMLMTTKIKNVSNTKRFKLDINMKKIKLSDIIVTPKKRKPIANRPAKPNYIKPQMEKKSNEDLNKLKMDLFKPISTILQYFFDEKPTKNVTKDLRQRFKIETPKPEITSVIKRTTLKSMLGTGPKKSVYAMAKLPPKEELFMRQGRMKADTGDDTGPGKAGKPESIFRENLSFEKGRTARTTTSIKFRNFVDDDYKHNLNRKPTEKQQIYDSINVSPRFRYDIIDPNNNNIRRLSEKNRFEKVKQNEEAYEKVRAIKKITELSSYEDEETQLRSNLDDALFHGHKDLYFNNVHRRMNEAEDKIIKGNVITMQSSASDEEHVLKSNIYKSFGFDTNFRRIKQESNESVAHVKSLIADRLFPVYKNPIFSN